jgi:hypothetical protein
MQRLALVAVFEVGTFRSTLLLWPLSERGIRAEIGFLDQVVPMAHGGLKI